MKTIAPNKLRKGAHIRVIAPSRSLSLISATTIEVAKKRLESLGFKVSFGKNVYVTDEYDSSTTAERVSDLHEAFTDKSVDCILTAIGGFNAIQILDSIDYDLIRKNPKVLMGFSDITILNCALLKKADLLTYSGPHFSSWGMVKHFEFSEKKFISSIMNSNSYELGVSDTWSDDLWYIDQDNRDFIDNSKTQFIVREGSAEGTIIGGNLTCFSSLSGTGYRPSMDGAILFLEDDSTVTLREFDRMLRSLTLQSDFKNIKGLVIGRFQKESNVGYEMLKDTLDSIKKFNGVPIIVNQNFGHTTPISVLPIGGKAKINAFNDKLSIQIKG